ncbi:hypothetical protein [Pseudomonas syringae]|uniref:hypothetical protein n=1 Tax=Pseudomonas syringae TaxID=317 RepID=UPI0032047458
MALIKCRECSTLISTQAQACPTCGAKAKKKTSLFTWLMLLIVVVIVYKSASPSTAVTSSSPASAQVGATPELPDLPEQARPPEVSSNWTESSYTDDLTDAHVKVNGLKSTTSVNFAFPYNYPGGSHLTLYIRKGGETFDAYFKVDKGQMLCHYSDCGFVIRVNGGKPQTWTGLTSSTGNADLMFIRDAKKFEKIVKSGGSLRVGIDFYHAGKQTFDFDLSGYPDR